LAMDCRPFGTEMNLRLSIDREKEIVKKTALKPMNSTLFFDPKNDRNEISEKSAPKFGRKNRVLPEDYAPRIFDSREKSAIASP
jgi:hypothetical protein